MKNRFITLQILFLLFFINSKAQSSRIHTSETIGWYNMFTTLKLDDRFGIHTEYQWRRADFIESWQQSLFRVGLNYQLNPRVLFRIGYGWIETFPYGEIPLNAAGRNFTEHRLFGMAQLSHREGIIDLSHRFMLEQRFVGRYSTPQALTEDEFPLLNRARYMIRLQIPLKGKSVQDNTPYAAVYDEVFIGFGKNVNANIFDQNRIGVLLGYRFNQALRLEAGYLNQTVQFGRLIDGRNIIQSNHGIILNAHINLDLTSRAAQKQVVDDL